MIETDDLRRSMLMYFGMIVLVLTLAVWTIVTEWNNEELRDAMARPSLLSWVLLLMIAGIFLTNLGALKKTREEVDK